MTEETIDTTNAEKRQDKMMIFADRLGKFVQTFQSGPNAVTIQEAATTFVVRAHMALVSVLDEDSANKALRHIVDRVTTSYSETK